MTTKQYFLTGIILLIIGTTVLGWAVISYVDLKKAEAEYKEQPKNTSPGSNMPYPTDGLFWERIGVILILFSTGIACLIKWKTKDIQRKKTEEH